MMTAQKNKVVGKQLDESGIPETFSPTDVFIPVMGVTGAGKSTFISLCADENVPIGHGLSSLTKSPCVYSLRRQGQIVRLIDTPGFDDTKTPDIEILTNLAYWLATAYQTTPKILLSGIIYLHPIHEPRFQGTARKNLTMFRLLCGEESMHSVVLATTMWSPEIEAKGAERVRQLETTDEFWGNMMKNGSTHFRHANTRESGLKIIDHILEKRAKVVLSIQRQMVDEKLSIDQTDAGQHKRDEIIKEKEVAERMLRENQQELEESLRKKEEEDVEELLEEQKKYEEEFQQKEQEIQALRMDVARLQQEKEAQMQREEEELQTFMGEQDAKVAEMQRELEALQKSQQDDSATLQEKRTEGFTGRSPADTALIERLASRMQENEIAMQSIFEQMERSNIEKETLKQQEKKRFAKRTMQFGGVGALFGGIAAGAAVLCSVM